MATSSQSPTAPRLDSSFEVVAGEEQQEEDWAMVTGGKDPPTSKSFLLSSDSTKLSTANTQDVDRWTPGSPMPSLTEFSNTLIELDLYKNRYIQELHPSICDLKNLQALSLVRCEQLQTLPDNIGNLTNLHTLNLMDASEISVLPCSIGNLIKCVNSV
jgi:Leucine-rich repeat (LRR) protein